MADPEETSSGAGVAYDDQNTEQPLRTQLLLSLSDVLDTKYKDGSKEVPLAKIPGIAGVINAWFENLKGALKKAAAEASLAPVATSSKDGGEGEESESDSSDSSSSSDSSEEEESDDDSSSSDSSSDEEEEEENDPSALENYPLAAPQTSSLFTEAVPGGWGLPGSDPDAFYPAMSHLPPRPGPPEKDLKEESSAGNGDDEDEDEEGGGESLYPQEDLLKKRLQRVASLRQKGGVV